MITASCRGFSDLPCRRMNFETGEWCQCDCHDGQCKTAKQDLIYRNSWDICDLAAGHGDIHQTYLGAGLAISWEKR